MNNKEKNKWMFIEEDTNIIESIKNKEWVIRTSRAGKSFITKILRCKNHVLECPALLRIDLKDNEQIFYISKEHNNICKYKGFSNKILKNEVIKLYERNIFRPRDIMSHLEVINIITVMNILRK